MTITKTTTKSRYSSKLVGKLLIITIVICTFVSLCYCKEQTSTAILNSKLKFSLQKNARTYYRKKDAPPAIVPTHCAYIRIRWYHHAPATPEVEELVKTSAGKSISPLQRDFLKTGIAISVSRHGTATSRGKLGFSHYEGWIEYILYAVSNDDVKKMAEAFAEVFLKQNNATLKPFLDGYLNKHHDKLRQYQKLVTETKAQIPKKEQELELLKTELDKLKERGYYQSEDQARKAILELNAMLHTENIELAGMKAKREAIEMHRARVRQEIEMQNETDRKTINWEPILLNLEQKYIDVMIDFEVAKARQATAHDLRGQSHFFLTKLNKARGSSGKVFNLKAHLEDRQARLQQIETVLANPEHDMLPLRLDTKIVNIYPVEIKTNE